ncbi:MAG TPA: peptidylprolyl isomerase [Tepidisphaeraceae bacterium]|nr:peptidylprolyl isomerase [Tepidisphaeraceae bacterium]
MKCKVAAAVLSVALVASPLAEGAQPTTLPNDAVVARVDDVTVTMGQLQKPLVEAYGLNVLLNLVQLELARQVSANAKVTVTEADIQRERKLTLDRMFRDAPEQDHANLFEQFLQQQNSSQAEFELVMATNAHLRKVAEPLLAGKISEENLKEAFGVIYGEKVQVRHIQGSNLQEIQEARRRIEAGEPFAAVARELSRNQRTGALGGLLPEFSRGTTDLPQSLKDAAFALKPGEMSDPVEAKGAYHLLMLEQRIPPKVFKFEDVKDSIREELNERAVQETVKQLRQQIVQQARDKLIIEHPQLKAQFQKMTNQREESQVKDAEGIRGALRRERERRGLPPDKDAPATQPLLPSPSPPGQG